MAGAYKIKCTCKHEYQDELYGKGIRAATPVNKTLNRDLKTIQARCTVCLRQQQVKL